jgi:hypothetical protein
LRVSKIDMLDMACLFFLHRVWLGWLNYDRS